MTVYAVTNCYGEILNIYSDRTLAVASLRGVEVLEEDNDPDIISEWELN